jgi:hypothetical protein
MKFRTFLITLALTIGFSLAQADSDQRAAHHHLLDLDLAALTQANTLDWRVPAAMARSDGDTVFVHRMLTEVDGGYLLAAVYGWRDSSWHTAGWRMMHPSVAPDWSEDNVLRNASQLPRRTYSVISTSAGESDLINYCTDAPDKHEPKDTSGSAVGDTRTITWTSSTQGPHDCAYETKFELQRLDGGTLDWIVVDFRFTLVRGDGDGRYEDAN